MKEYRVVWKREGKNRKTRRFAYRKNLERFLILLGPEPWKAWGKSSNDYACCPGTGYECGCSGMTVKEESDAKRENIPPIEYLRVESREIGTWSAESRTD